MDGFFRVLAKTSSELICPRLHNVTKMGFDLAGLTISERKYQSKFTVTSLISKIVLFDIQTDYSTVNLE